jgi:hypothetical protein
MRHRIALAVLPLLLAAASAGAQVPAGAESPQAVVAAVQKATTADDFGMVVAYIAPQARRELASDGLTGLLMALAFSDPDDAMPGSTPLPKAELEKKRKDYKAAVALATRTLSTHGITGVIGKPVMAEATRASINAALDTADTVAFMRDMVATLDAIGPMLGMTKSDKPRVPFALGKVSDYKIVGDTATARADTEVLDFVRIDGRWYLTPPAGAR